MTFVEEARRLIGTVWRHQGTSERGIDCIGLVKAAAERAGYPVIHLPAYKQEADVDQLLEHCDRHFDRVPMQDLASGDVIVMRFEKDPQHFAIVADHPQGGFSIIHAFKPVERVVEHRLSGWFQQRIYLALRFRT